MAKPTLEIWFGYAILAGAVAMVFAAIRTERRGWVKDEDGEVHRREDSAAGWWTVRAFYLAYVVVLVLTGLGVLGYLGW